MLNGIIHVLQCDRPVEFALSNGNLDLFKKLWTGSHNSKEVSLYNLLCLFGYYW